MPLFFLASKLGARSTIRADIPFPSRSVDDNTTSLLDFIVLRNIILTHTKIVPLSSQGVVVVQEKITVQRLSQGVECGVRREILVSR